MRYLILLLALLASPVMAAELTISWEWPTLRDDGSPQPTSGPFALTSVRIEIGTCAGANFDQFGTKQMEVVGMWPATSVKATVTSGIKCVRGYSKDASNLESVASNIGRYAPAPAPINLQATGKIAYEMRKKADGDFQFVQVGTVPLGVKCGRVLAGGMAIVDGAKITKPLQGGVIAAKCS